MPAPRDYDSVVAGDEGMGYSSSARPVFGTVSIVSARDLFCTGCQAEPGEDCRTGRMSTGRVPVPLLCSERLDLARAMRDQGQLAVTRVAPQARCHKCTMFSGQVKACPEHQCRHGDCTSVALPGTRFCGAHAGLARQKVTPEVLAEMQRLLGAGMTRPQIAQRVGISPGTTYRYLSGADRNAAER